MSRTSLFHIGSALLFAVPGFAQEAKRADMPAAASLRLTDVLPVDSSVRIGTLPNGLRYYIRENRWPEKRAELRLVVNAGSILESESQRGLAHFVEHTAFNGTTNFAENDLVKYLQSIGVRFGADLNARTGFDETVYILPIPTDTASIVDRAFTILEDWAHGQIFDSTEIVAERGVVREEFRGRRGAGDRMLKQVLPIAFRNSLYAERLPIGTEESIMSATPSRLRAFYRDWYRPDLMAVVAVGDFKTADIEAKIRKHFGGLQRPAGAPARRIADVPGNKAPLVAIASDKEAVSNNVSLIFKHPRESTTTVGDYRRDLIGRLYLQMLNGRLGEMAQKPDAPFLAASASRGGFLARNLVPFSLGARVKDGGVERGVEALLIEAKRVDQLGFLQSELDRARTNLLRSYERAYAERARTQSGSYAEEYIRNYLEGETIPGIAYEYRMTEQLLPTVTLRDVNRMAAGWITDENRVVIVQATEKQGVALPTSSGLLAAFDRAAKAPVTAFTENVSTDELIPSLRPAGTVVSQRTIPGVGVTEWKLSNGVRVLIKPTDFKSDEIVFGAYSAGGTSLASDQDFMSASLASQIVGLSGLGSFNRIDLGKKLSGKAVSIATAIDAHSEGLRGGASPKDLETLFKVIYLQFTAPRLDTSAYAAFKASVATSLANRGASPVEVFKDTIQVTMAQRDVRARPVTLATFSEVNPEKAVSFFKDRFSDAGDFTFVFVGNTDTLTLKPLVERYLASLPAAGRVESAKVTGKGPPKGVIERTVNKGVEPKVSTLIAFTGPCVYSPENRFAIGALADVFELRLVETLREKLGGTYSPSVGGSCGRVPRQQYAIQIQFESSPDNADKLTEAVFALIDTLKANGPSSADVEKVKEQLVRSREVSLKQNAYWLGNIIGRDQAGEDLSGLLAPYDEMVRELTPAQIQNSARLYFDVRNYARFRLLPETAR